MSNIEYRKMFRKVANALPGWHFDFDQLDSIGKKIDNLENQDIYPQPEQVLRCFYNLSPIDIKVVILGQDCYHTPGVANGLAFSTNQSTLPPSLQNIFKELNSDLGIRNTNGNLMKWKDQGVLLLNTYLTVERGKPNSHANIWEGFTENVIRVLLQTNRKMVFILWGKFAQNCFYDSFRAPYGYEIISFAHPSPFSADKGFFGSKPFSRTNEFLKKNNIPEIDWRT